MFTDMILLYTFGCARKTIRMQYTVHTQNARKIIDFQFYYLAIVDLLEL